MLPSGQPASKGQLTIERLACRINLPGSIEDAASVAGRVERMARSDVANTCAEHLHWPDDDAVYRIRHLHLSLWLDKSTISSGEISHRWGGLLATAIMKSVRSGATRNVVRFASPRHFVTAFLSDLIDGRGWEQWYYEEFHHLRRMPVGSITAQLLAARPDWIVPTFNELERTGHVSRLLARMTHADVSRLWSALSLPPEPSPGLLLSIGSSGQDTLSRLLSRWPSVALSYGFDQRSRARDRFVMFLAVNHSSSISARDHAAAAVIHTVVDLIALNRVAPDLAMMLMMRSELYPQAVQRIASGSLADILGWLTPLSRTSEGREKLSELAEAASTIVMPQIFANGGSDPNAPSAHKGHSESDVSPSGRVSTESDPSSKRSASSDVDAGPEPTFPADSVVDPDIVSMSEPGLSPALSSPVGSVFLLTPALAETGLWDHWLAEHGEEMARRFVFTLALKALGRQRAPLYLGDRMLTAFAGMEHPPVADARVPVVEDGTPGPWPAAIPEIASRWYPESERDVTEGTAHGLHVVRDSKFSCWLSAWPSSDRPILKAQAINQALTSGTSGMPRRMSDTEQTTLEAEVAHLQLGQRLGYPWLTPSLDAALSTAASLVLRRTASRLPRLSASSPAYLANQFLAQPATLRFDSAFATVELSGGPLGIVLRLAALPEWIQAPWLSAPVSLKLSNESGSM